MKKFRLAVSAAAVVLAAGVLAGCGGSDEAADSSKPAGTGAAKSAEPEAAEEKQDAPAEVKIVKSGFEDHDVWGPNSYVVHWELTNTGDKAGNFFAGLDFLDADGDVLGSTGITADKLGPGKTSKGNIAPLDVEITNGEMGDIKDVKVSDVERMDP